MVTLKFLFYVAYREIKSGWHQPTHLQAAYIKSIGVDIASFVTSLDTYVSYSFLNGFVTLTLKLFFGGCFSDLCWLECALCRADRVLG